MMCSGELHVVVWPSQTRLRLARFPWVFDLVVVSPPPLPPPPTPAAGATREPARKLIHDLGMHMRSLCGLQWERLRSSHGLCMTASTTHTRWGCGVAVVWCWRNIRYPQRMFRLRRTAGRNRMVITAGLAHGPQATIGIDFLSKTMYLEDRTVRSATLVLPDAR